MNSKSVENLLVVLVVFLLLFAPSHLGAADCSVAPEAVRFPPDVYLFHGLVEEPLVEGGDEWVLRVRVLEPIHLPETLLVFDIVPQKLDQDCSPVAWTRREMIDGFISGDEVKVAAYVTGATSEIGSPQLASTPVQGIVLLAGRAVGSIAEVRDSYDYLWALHRMEKELEDIKKIGILTAIGRWVDDREAFSLLLDAQLSQRRFRHRVLSLYDSHHGAKDEQP